VVEIAGLLVDGVRNALLMAYDVWWALVFGFAISAVVQAWVPRRSIERRLAGQGVRPAAWATGLGAASSSCSYAAIAIARSLFLKGASLRAALAFQFASTNLVWELGLVLWVLIGWQFALGELVGGLVLIALMWSATRLVVSAPAEEAARRHAIDADTGHHHHAGAAGSGWRRRLASAEAWSDVARNFRGDWHMLYREIAVGFVLAGFIGLLPTSVFDALFLQAAPVWIRIPENAIVGPVIAVLSFVCSVGNVPLAAVLWAGGLSFAGVMAFIFADLIVVPIVLVYRKYYGAAFALRITVLMFGTMVMAALLVDLLFSGAHVVPNVRPATQDVFMGVSADYKLVLDLAGLVVFAILFGLAVHAERAAAAVGVPAHHQHHAHH
jgi:uncharacterized membrane protein YraQ (UPF0718 family)